MNDIVITLMYDLAHHLMVKFKLPPNRPNNGELKEIIFRMSQIPVEERTVEKWHEVVINVVKFDGFYFYKGLDLSDLNMLHNQILQLLRGKKK
jgi:hypothetical protein